MSNINDNMKERESLLSFRLRFVDVDPDRARKADPRDFLVELGEGERVVSVETVKDAFGYSWARVWIEQAPKGLKDES